MFKKVLWIICVVVVIGVSAFSTIIIKSSFKEAPTLAEFKKLNPLVGYGWLSEEEFRSTYPYYQHNIKSLKDIEEGSDLVVKVETLDDGTPAAYSLIRKCKITNLIKGNSKEDIVYIYEPSYFVHTMSYWCEQGYISMEKGKNYVVFLKTIKNTEKVKKKELVNGYILANPTFGKYRLGEEAIVTDYDPTKKTMYFKEIYNLSVWLTEKKDVNLYNSILKEIEKSYENFK